MKDNIFIAPDETGFKASVLDSYLAAGFYRMGHNMFTTCQTRLSMNPELYPVFWLRSNIKKIKESKSARAIRKKCSQFKVEYKKANITSEIEELYSNYHTSIDFDTASTCLNYLNECGIENPFDSWMVEVRDNAALIGVGYFDIGNRSIAGILNFYHPGYKKCSLGKFLILKKLDYAFAHQMEYYYTGYISTTTDKFDYKLFPDKEVVEVYLSDSDEWQPYTSLGKEGLQEYYRNYLCNNEVSEIAR